MPVHGGRARHTVRNLAVTIALATAAFLIVAAPTRAAPTKVTWPTFIQVKAAPHTTNHIRMFYELVKGATPDQSGWVHGVFDSAGITTRVTEPPTCYPIARVLGSGAGSLAGKALICPDGSSVGDFPPGQGEDFRVLLGDRSDRFDAEKSIGSFEVHGGSGNDTEYGNDAPTVQVDYNTNTVCGYFTEDELYGDRGNDRLYGRRGPDLLSGGSGNDRLNGGKVARADRVPGDGYCPGFGGGQGDNLRGGSGNDVLWAVNHTRDRLIDCGPGRDKAFLDRRDPKPKGCERVKRS